MLYFGIEDDSLALAGIGHAADAKHCRRCGAPYAFDVVYLGHLGHYHCRSCGQARPQPRVSASEVTLAGVRSSAFTCAPPPGRPGWSSAYRASTTSTTRSPPRPSRRLAIPLPTIVAGLQGAKAAFGRAETLQLDDRELRILLVKNPAGANEVLRTLALEPGAHDLLAVLNDNIADGRDVSWVWDADFELLAGRVRRVTCAGTRAAEMALRLKYAGSSAPHQRDRRAAPSWRSRTRRRSSRRVPPTREPLYALPTYTAMLALRELLAAGGEWPAAGHGGLSA